MHHGWTPVRVQRVGAKESEFDEECDEVSFINVGGSLRGKVQTRQAMFLTPVARQ